jgi:hypothetical protein
MPSRRNIRRFALPAPYAAGLYDGALDRADLIR